MRWSKRIFETTAVQAIAARSAAWLLRAIMASIRWRRVNDGAFNTLLADGTPFLIVCWHGRLLPLPFLWPKGVPVTALISTHRDGRLISQTVSHLGVGTIAGSTTRGGRAALLQIVKELQAGRRVGLTPDGPQGPRMRAAPGTAAAALFAKVPVVPVGAGCTRRRYVGSWDRMLIPLPFGQGVFVVGDPIPPEGTVESLTAEIEAALNRLTAEADRLTGHPPVEPGP